ncbi:hypothetical protein KFE25_011583 [Diacronema lutheri]|uniref:Signal sequence receptor subunit alpha n=2 Tax=Diacronema lutheri TaxID=2081491 RepID=A0A8J5XE29_DIALT|nr:hypothetical protein KFE25_011583 [Diacronema lutheri]
MAPGVSPSVPLRVALRVVLALALGRGAGCASSAPRFHTGDLLPVMKRSQFRGERSEWREVPHEACPRFERPSVVALLALPADFIPPDEGVAGATEYKMAFSFLNEQFQTPWITIADGRGQYLTQLVFTLEHAGDQVTDVSWELVYDAPSKPPPSVHLEYQFVDAAEADPRTALTAMFAGSLLLAALSVMIVAADSGVDFGLQLLGGATHGAQRRRPYDEA